MRSGKVLGTESEWGKVSSNLSQPSLHNKQALVEPPEKDLKTSDNQLYFN